MFNFRSVRIERAHRGGYICRERRARTKNERKNALVTPVDSAAEMVHGTDERTKLAIGWLVATSSCVRRRKPFSFLLQRIWRRSPTNSPPTMGLRSRG